MLAQAEYYEKLRDKLQKDIMYLKSIKEICTKDSFNYSFDDVCYIVMIY